MAAIIKKRSNRRMTSSRITKDKLKELGKNTLRNDVVKASRIREVRCEK
jgi:polyhydroxyalkanoate synthesis regulator protein